MACMPGRIDVHAHLLPGLDDGSKSVEESIDMARMMAEAGYGTIVCTPHVWPHLTQHRPAFIAQQVQSLQAQLDEARIPIRLVPGGELYVELDIFSMPPDQIPTYANQGRHAIFDFWGNAWPEQIWIWVARLRSLGIEPIVAHPERVELLRDNPHLVEQLEREGLRLQGNLESLSGNLGPATLRLAERLLTEGRYFMLGSDLHRAATLPQRIEGLKHAIDLVGEARVDELTRTRPATLFS
jgi:protein-tyrosine phosphatase